MIHQLARSGQWRRCRTSVITRLAIFIGLLHGVFPRSEAAPVGALFTNPPTWGPVVEPDFPFFTATVDGRKRGSGRPTENLTPRGLVIRLAPDCWVCFDTDLLRVAGIWTGPGLSAVSMSQGSYQNPGIKTPEGQDQLPQPVGTLWIENGLYPGWQTGTNAVLSDPRDRGPDARELGRGPLDFQKGRFESIQIHPAGIELHYTAGRSRIQETMTAEIRPEGTTIHRHVRLSPVLEPLVLIVGQRSGQDSGTVTMELSGAVEPHPRSDGLLAVQVHPRPTDSTFTVTLTLKGTDTGGLVGTRHPAPDRTGTKRWPESVVTRGTLAPATQAFVVDSIPLPLDNPWHRNLRLADLAFYRDGRAAAVTFDGDIWLIHGLHGELKEVTWRRFTSGLHEPMGISVRDEQLYVFDRIGIWRLVDEDRDGEADRHELFSNAFVQTAETREFAAGLRLAPDGSFIIAKGGQEGTSLGRHNGSVLRLSPDGSSSTVLGYGLRQPLLGVHPKTGMITVSDQQGHYIPATPIHLIENHQYYGYLPLILPKERYPAPITEPLTWIPHSINASGAGQVWLTEGRMGALDGAWIHLGYYRPEAFVVLPNIRGAGLEAAVVSLTRDFDFAPLAGAVNPVDGQLYVTGFQIFGSTAAQISGLARVRHTGLPCRLPAEVAAMKEGVLLRFHEPLDPDSAQNPARFSAERWNYQRTANYGSPHFKLDGSKGQETMTASSAYVSRDHRSVFVGFPDMRPVMQMRVGWALASADGRDHIEQSAYLTPRELPSFQPTKEGFEPVTVNLQRRTRGTISDAIPKTPQEGKRVAELMGCVACHSADGTTIGKFGPTWKGLYGAARLFADGTRGLADENYLRESIQQPSAKVVLGFEKSDTGMPSYEGVLSLPQIEALIEYLKSLQ